MKVVGQIWKEKHLKDLFGAVVINPLVKCRDLQDLGDITNERVIWDVSWSSDPILHWLLILLYSVLPN